MYIPTLNAELGALTVRYNKNFFKLCAAYLFRARWLIKKRYTCTCITKSFYIPQLRKIKINLALIQSIHRVNKIINNPYLRFLAKILQHHMSGKKLWLKQSEKTPIISFAFLILKYNLLRVWLVSLSGCSF